MARLFDRLLASRGPMPIAGPCVVVDNVARYAETHDLFADSYRVSNAPNVAPPFDTWWMEARSSRAGFPREFGMLMTGRLASGKDVSTMAKERDRCVLERPDLYPRGDLVRSPLSGHFFLANTFFARGGVGWPTSPVPIYTDAMLVNKDGSITPPGITRLVPVDRLRLDPGLLVHAVRLRRVFHLALSFMHCRNVDQEIVDQPPKLAKGWKKKHGHRLVRYRVLDIDPMKQTLESVGGASENGLKKALHICRGHFATYTEDAPLFGNYVGSVWKPQHVRGSARQGVVVKDYRVLSP